MQSTQLCNYNWKTYEKKIWFGWFMVFNATFNNISVILVEETGIPAENHRPVTSH